MKKQILKFLVLMSFYSFSGCESDLPNKITDIDPSRIAKSAISPSEVSQVENVNYSPNGGWTHQIKFFFDDQIPNGTWDGYSLNLAKDKVREAIENWNDALEKEIFIECNFPANRAGEDGIIIEMGGTGVARINPTLGGNGTEKVILPPISYGGIFLGTAFHELAHVLGLKHCIVEGVPCVGTDPRSCTSNSIMDSWNQPVATANDLHTLNTCLGYFEFRVPGPLNVTVSGPSYIWVPGKYQGYQTHIWTANVSGGIAPYSYEWSRQVQGGTRYLVGTGASYSRQYYFIGYYQDVNVTHTVEVTDCCGGFYSASISVFENSVPYGPGGSP